MATAAILDGMNDPKLKPRLLRSLLRDLLPDEKRPSTGPAELAAVLSCVKTHGLLSESLPGGCDDTKLIESWRSAVDEWVDRLLSLVSSKTPDKCWAGASLLGVTCEECSSDRFLASYSIWFQELLSNLQPPCSSHFVKVASCASLGDLFTRLVGFSNVKKETISLAVRLVEPVLQLLSEDDVGSIWGGAVDLLCCLIISFPSAVHRHYEKAEAALVAAIMSGKCSADVSKKVATCLALLPKVKGDEDSWSSMMQKLLISINMLLSDAFEGLEEETKGNDIMKLLVPPGKDPPPPLGGQSVTGGASERGINRLHVSLVPRVSTLIHCCCIMLTNPYPIQVAVPVHAVLALVGRVLLLDGSLHQRLLPFTTAMHQELICSELPALHLDSLDLLIATIKGVRSQLLPHAANVVRLLTEYFRKAALPCIRIKVYSIIQILLISMGVGMALYLTQEVISNAFTDLHDHLGSGLPPSNVHPSKVVSYRLHQSSHRKRKHASGVLMEHSNGFDHEFGSVSRKPTIPLAVKIAALRALEALLTVGGSLRSECWRPEVDLLLITVATNACDAGWACEGKLAAEDSASSRADFQLAALEALLASLLSPAHVRPPYLSQGLGLFRRGKQETGTKLAAFCAHALLALEVLIHPRALPMDNFPVAKTSTTNEGLNFAFPESTFHVAQKPYTPPFSMENLEDEEMYNSWLRNGEAGAVDSGDLDKHAENTSKQTVEVSHTGTRALVDSVTDKEHSERNRGLQHDANLEMREATDVVSEKPQEQNSSAIRSVETRTKPASPGVDSSLPDRTLPRDNEPPTGKADAVLTSALDLGKDINASANSGAVVFNRRENISAEGDAVASNDVTNFNQDASYAPEKPGIASRDEGAMSLYDSETDSMDSLPDIVDADPDSDY